MIRTIILFTFCCLFLTCDQPAVETSNNKNTTTEFNEPPAWAKDAIWYQIFIERFRNGDPNNAHQLKNIEGSWPHKFGDNWKTTSWTSNWYENKNNYEAKDFNNADIQTRRYGGDLQGVFDKLDYLQELGVNALYFNPLNDAPSLHKFDARNYRHIDINIGSDPEGDIKIIASEDPIDPKTWKWTSADLLFLKLIKELHQRDMKLILDYSWNHTGIKFWAWQDILKNGKNSKYADWYEITSFDDPSTSKNEFDYIGWAGVRELPELKKVDVENRVHGKTYKGNIHPEVKQHIFNVNKRWLDPNGDGDTEDGIDGFRLDVADQIGMDFWKEYRKYVRSINPDALLVGEVWWQSWPDTLMDPRPYVNGDIFDIVMFYQAYKPARAFFAKTKAYQGAAHLKKEWERVTAGMSDKTIQSMMVMSASHDSPRLLTSFQNKGKYKVRDSNKDYVTGQPDEETMERVKLYLAFQFTMVGAPQIWAGDEMGMWGGDDPECRKPLWWDDLTFENETADPFKTEPASYPIQFNKPLFSYYKKLIKIRKEHPVLRTGELKFLFAEGDVLVFERKNKTETIKVFINNSKEKISLPNNISSHGIDLLDGKQKNIAPTNLEMEGISALVILED